MYDQKNEYLVYHFPKKLGSGSNCKRFCDEKGIEIEHYTVVHVYRWEHYAKIGTEMKGVEKQLKEPIKEGNKEKDAFD